MVINLISLTLNMTPLVSFQGLANYARIDIDQQVSPDTNLGFRYKTLELSEHCKS